MVIRNGFLVNLTVHNHVMNGCFCQECRVGRSVQYRVYNNRHLFRLFKSRLPHEENTKLMKCFESVLTLIVVGKVYKDSCLANTGYVQFKSWANVQPQYSDWEPKALKAFCDRVNDAAYVFDNWDVIIQNLMDARMDCLDARRFSVGQFKQAKELSWCLIENENLRRNSRKPDEPRYPEDKYKDILQNILNSGILDDIDRDPHVAAMIGKRLQKDIVQRCRLRR